MKKKKGFTLIELLISSCILSLVLMGTLPLFKTTYQHLTAYVDYEINCNSLLDFVVVKNNLLTDNKDISYIKDNHNIVVYLGDNTIVCNLSSDILINEVNYNLTFCEALIEENYLVLILKYNDLPYPFILKGVTNEICIS